MSNLVNCPSCRHEFELSYVLEERIATEARLKATAEVDRVRADAERQITEALAGKDSELESARKKVADASQKEVDLVRREHALADRQREQELEIEKRLNEERALLQQATEDRFAREMGEKLRTKDSELESARRKASQAAQKEADVMRRERELIDRQREQELEIEKRLNEERALLQKATEERFALEMDEKLRAKDSELERARRKASEAAQKEADVMRRERELVDRQREQELEIEKKLNEERALLHKATEERFAREMDEKLRAKDSELESARRKASQAAEKEADVMRRERELVDRQREQELEIEKELNEGRALIQKATEERFASEMEEKLRANNSELESARRKAFETAQKEVDLLRREHQLADRQREQELEIEKKLNEERTRMRESERKDANARLEQELAEQLRAKNDEIDAARAKLDHAARRESELFKRERQVEDAKREAELDVERRLAAETARIRDEAEAKAAERYDIRARDLREQLQLQEQEQTQSTRRLQKQVDVLTVQLQQKSQQLQGEVQEIALKDRLGRSFPRDEISDVPVGMEGADLVHHVRNQSGGICGVILWESKRTKQWSNDWLPKLRDDQRNNAAHCAVLVTQAMPPGLEEFGEVDGTWVCSWSHATRLAAALRAGLIDVAAARRGSEGQTGKMQLVYNYLTSHEFKHRVEGVIEALSEMEDDLRAEQRSMKSIWRKRQKQLDRAHDNMASIYGDLRGLSGRQIETIPGLELGERGDAALLESGDVGDVDEADMPFAEHTIHIDTLPQFADLLHELIPASDSIGNKTLFDSFQTAAVARFSHKVSQQDFERCKIELIAKNKIRRWMGRGGSVMRVKVVSTSPATRDNGNAVVVHQRLNALEQGLQSMKHAPATPSSSRQTSLSSDNVATQTGAQISPQAGAPPRPTNGNTPVSETADPIREAIIAEFTAAELLCVCGGDKFVWIVGQHEPFTVCDSCKKKEAIPERKTINALARLARRV